MPATKHPKCMYVLVDELANALVNSVPATEAKSQRFQTCHAVAKKKVTEKIETVKRMQAKLAERQAKKIWINKWTWPTSWLQERN